MRERDEVLGGSLRMDSGPGAGERVKVRVPLAVRKTQWTGVRHPVHVLSECDGFAKAPARCCSALRVTGKRTQDWRERVLAGFLRSASILRGIVRDLPFTVGERQRGRRCPGIGASELYTPERGSPVLPSSFTRRSGKVSLGLRSVVG